METRQSIVGQQPEIRPGIIPLKDTEGGLVMHPLYAAANEVVDQLRTARLEVARLSAQLAQAEYNLRLSQARVERA